MKNASHSFHNSVLVVDDDEFGREVMCEMLSHLGLEIIQQASNGACGLKVLGDMPTPPEFVCLDIFMPDMDGIEFLEKLKLRNFSGKVILMSGGDQNMLDIAKEVATANGINVIASLTKPLQLNVLAKLMGLVQTA